MARQDETLREPSILSVRLLDAGAEGTYDRFLESRPEAVIYHTPEWRDLIRETYGVRPFYLYARDEHGLCGVLNLFEIRTPLRGLRACAIPLSHEVPVLAPDPQVREALLKRAEALGIKRGWRYAEIRHGFSLNSAVVASESKAHFQSELDLSAGLDAAWKGLDSGTIRWGIRKAMRDGVEVRDGCTLEDFRIFYELEVKTRHRQGMPVYPWRFFELMHKKFYAAGRCFLHLGFDGKKPVSGVIVLEYNGRAIFGYSATTARKGQAAHLVLWEAICASFGRGARVFDFGTTPLANRGLLGLKKRWGTDTRGMTYGYIGSGRKPAAMKRDGAGVKVAAALLKVMPRPLFARVGPHLLKESF